MAELNIKVGLDSSQLQSGLQRVEQQVSRLSAGGLATGFKALAADLANATSPADLLSRTMGRLGDVLKGTVFGAAGLAIGKILAAPFEQVNQIVKDSTDVFSEAIKNLQRSGDSLNFEQAVGEVDMLVRAVDQIDQSIKKIDDSPFRRLVSSITGARAELEAQQATLMRNAGTRMAQGLANETERTKFTQGMSSDEKALFEISERQRKREEQIRNTFKGRWSPAADQAMNESFSLFAQERNAKLDEIKKRTNDKETQDRIQRDQEALRREEEEKRMERESYERRRASRRERMSAEFQAGLDQAKEIVQEAQKSGVSVEQIMRERDLKKSFDEGQRQRIQEENAQRQERLRQINLQRGNALDFDPLKDRVQKTDAVFNNQLKKPDELLNPVQSLLGQVNKVVERLDSIDRKAGTFS